MVGSVNSYGAGFYQANAYSGNQRQTKTEQVAGDQQKQQSGQKTSSDQVNISNTGKALAFNEFKPTGDVTDARAVAKQHLAQQKLAYEQKNGVKTPDYSEQANKAKPDLSDPKAVAKTHMAEQKLTYERSLGIAPKESATSAKPAADAAKSSTANTPVDLTDAKAVAKAHLAQQKRDYAQNHVTTAAERTTQQQGKAIKNYLAVQGF